MIKKKKSSLVKRKNSGKKLSRSQHNILLDYDFASILPTAVLITDTKQKIIWWNPAAEKLLNLNKDCIQKTLGKMFPQFKVAFKARQKKATFILPHPTKPNIYLSINLMPYHDDQLLLLLDDITHLHHLENMRRDFVANVSHELRTPLTVIHGYLETLLEEKKVSSHLLLIFKQMYQQSLRMEKLIEDLLLLSHLEIDIPQNQKIRPVPVAKLLLRIVEDASALSGERKHKIRLEVDQKLMVEGLEDELQSAFSNLVFNAISYTPANGKIIVRWYRDVEHAYLEVQDTGIGIAPEHIPRITERFYRVDRARSRSSGGTGLGLAIVKHALLRHQAQLKISSQLGHGSTFTCVFPKKIIY